MAWEKISELYGYKQPIDIICTFGKSEVSETFPIFPPHIHFNNTKVINATFGLSCDISIKEEGGPYRFWRKVNVHNGIEMLVDFRYNKKEKKIVNHSQFMRSIITR